LCLFIVDTAGNKWYSSGVIIRHEIWEGNGAMQISVKAARVNAKMGQEEVAEALGLSVTGYRKKENGQSKFYADELATLSQLFSVPMLNFFEAGCRNKTQQGA
jgi:DNA-binding XRE family transcriptional regulator